MPILYVKDATGNFVAVPALVGKEGKTPERGVDYWTPDDKREIVDEVLASLPTAEEASF